MISAISQPIRRFLAYSRTGRNYLFILREFKHFPRVVLLALVFSLLAATFEGVGIGFLLSFLQSLTHATTVPAKTGNDWIDVWILGINGSVNDRLCRISILILLSTWLRATFNYLSAVYIEICQLRLLDRLRQQIFEQLQSFELGYFAKTKSGELINTITTELERIKTFFGGIAYMITRGLAVLVYVITLLLMSWQLTLTSVLLFSLMAVGLSALNTIAREASFEISATNGQFTSTAIEFINGIRTVHAYASQEFERKHFYRDSAEIVKAGEKAVRVFAGVKPLAEAIATAILIVMIIAAFTGAFFGITLPAASLLTFFFVLFRLVPSLQELNGTRAVLSMLTGAAMNIQALLKKEDKPYFQNGTLEFSGLKRSIDLISVDFGYTADQLVLHNITLSIEQGKVTALVGASGSGKTTLVDLLPRFYDPTLGRVLIDGIDLNTYDITSLRRRMAVVSQDTFIFNTSIRNNVVYNLEGITEAEIWDALRQAHALDFVQALPEGLETQLGDRGVRLSGGQRQRLAIARAVLRNPEILILDEATSALDSVSERLIQASIEQLAQGRTVVVIAHRLSTIARADKVVVLEQGQIVEQGKYQDLLDQHGKLWNYHQLQYELGTSS